MRDTRLAGAHMTSVSLDRVSWFNTNPALVIATGAGAFLTGASFDTADLPGLDLSGACLQGATMTNVQLTGANVTGARLDPIGGGGGGTTCPQSVASLASAFLIGTDSTVSVITDGDRCPNGAFGTTGTCGPLSSSNWTATRAPDQPTNCTPGEVDPDGNVISLNCQSNRH